MVEHSQRRLMGALFAVVLPGLVLPPTGAEGRQAAPGVDPKAVDAAVKKGIEHLRTSDSPGWSYGVEDSDELVLLTLITAGVPEDDPKVESLLRTILAGPLATTYEVSVQAMALEELNRVKHQRRIAQCAQFLVDNQCRNGQWSYGKPTVAVENVDVPTNGGGSAVASQGRVRNFGTPARGEKPAVLRKIPVRKTREGPDGGDNSNAQYAALGLRACHDAGIVIPKETLSLAKRWWTESPIAPRARETSVPTSGGLSGIPLGWCYRAYHHNLKYCKNPDQAYASMTAGAVGALAIYDHILGIDWTRDKAAQNGLAWLATHGSWTENSGPAEIDEGKPKTFLYYTFYAIERVGMLCELEKIGGHDWYDEGARALLQAQKANGSWLTSTGFASKSTWDTCFAILFLKRATRPLVASEDSTRRR